jgi:predicted RNase H-like HicB family nuclease
MYTAEMTAPKTFTVRAIWDDEARVWVATSDDVPGLATEADDMEALVEKLKSMIPELLQANGIAHDAQVPFEILGQRFAIARREAA